MVIANHRLAELPELMRDLMISEEYFISVDYGTNVNYETDDYWSESIDPDGNKRSLINEFKEQASEVKYIADHILSDYCDDNVRVLDVGCGQGAFLSHFKKSTNILGIEPSKLAAKRGTERGFNIQQGYYKPEMVNGEKFDYVVSHHVIEHIADPVRFLEDLKQPLKKGGTLIIGTPDFDSAMARRFRENYRLLGPEHISLFSLDSMSRMLRDNGLQIIRTEFPYFETRFIHEKNLENAISCSGVSPAFYGNYMTFFAKKTDD